MNLIEQLGGYALAIKMSKEWESSIDGDIPLDTMMYSYDFGIFSWGDLQSALLEHRRQHNIYEIDDYIIHDGELKVFAMWSSAVEGCAYIGYAYAENGEMAHKDEFRHATDEEIKAGKRLEVKSEN